MKRNCIQCGKEFELTDSEINFYKSKNLHLPKRCKDCREKNKSGDSGNRNNSTSDGNYTKQSKANSVSLGKNRSGKDKGRPIAVIALVLVVAVIAFGKFGDKFFSNTDTPVLPSINNNTESTKPLNDENSTETTDHDSNTEYYYEEEENNTEYNDYGEEDITPSGGSGYNGGVLQNESNEDETPETEYYYEPETEAPRYKSAYRFRNAGLLNQHYKKHGIDMGFDSEKAYEAAAAAVIENPNALYKTEAEDGDGVYFLKSTGEFVVLSTDGYIRTYYYADYGYFERQ